MQYQLAPSKLLGSQNKARHGVFFMNTSEFLDRLFREM